MKVATTPPNTARGEATITIGGKTHPIRFGMNVMRDVSKATNTKPSEFGALLSEDYDLALSAIVGAAIRRYVPTQAEITQDEVCDLIDALQPDEADAIAEAITEAVAVGNPLLQPLTAKVAAKSAAVALASTKSGITTSTSDSAS